MLNIAAIMGRLTADPELRHTPNNVPVTSFSVAVARSFVRQGQERETDFINVVAWRSTAEFVCRYFKKGNMIAVNGSIQTRKYQDRDGNNRTAFEILADNVHFCESKSSASQSGGTTFSMPQQPPQSDVMSFSSGSTGDFEEIASDDDLPF